MGVKDIYFGDNKGGVWNPKIIPYLWLAVRRGGRVLPLIILGRGGDYILYVAKGRHTTYCGGRLIIYVM